MPVRSFRSTAFSPIAPQRPRLIPFVYVAYPIDGPGPVISSQPKDSTNPPPEFAELEVGLIDDSDATFAWQLLGDDGLWNDVVDDDTFSGATTSELTIGPISPSDDSSQFRCIITGVNGIAISRIALVYGSF